MDTQTPARCTRRVDAGTPGSMVTGSSILPGVHRVSLVYEVEAEDAVSAMLACLGGCESHLRIVSITVDSGQPIKKGTR